MPPNTFPAHTPLPTAAMERTAPDKHRFKRSRVASCANCRRRKLRCDRRMPCSSCVERREVEMCKWDDVLGWGQGGVVDSQSASPGTHRPRDMLECLEECQRRLNQVQSVIDDGLRSSTSSQGSTSKHLTLSELNSDIWKAIYAISLLPPLDELKKAISSYFYTLSISYYTIEESLFIDEFQQRYPRIAHIQSLVQSGKHDAILMMDACRQWELTATLEDATFLGLLLAVYGMSLAWGVAPRRKSLVESSSPRSMAFVNVETIMQACRELYIGIQPIEQPTINGLRLCLSIIIMICITSGSLRIVGLLAEAVQIASSLGLDVEPSATTEIRTARDRIHLFITMTTFDWMGSLTFKPYLLLPAESIRHPLLYGNPHNSPWLGATIDGAPFLTQRMRFKTLLAATARKTYELGNKRNGKHDPVIVDSLERDRRQLESFVPLLVKEVGYRNERAIAHATDLKAFIAVQRLSFFRAGGKASALQMYKSSQDLVSMVADTICSIASPTMPGHNPKDLIYGIKSDTIPLLWYSLQVCQIGLYIVEKAEMSGLSIPGDAKTRRDNVVCRELLRELEENGMKIQRAVSARSFIRVFEEGQSETTDSSPDTSRKHNLETFPATFEELNEFLTWPLLPINGDCPDLMSSCLPSLEAPVHTQ